MPQFPLPFYVNLKSQICPYRIPQPSWLAAGPVGRSYWLERAIMRRGRPTPRVTAETSKQGKIYCQDRIFLQSAETVDCPTPSKVRGVVELEEEEKHMLCQVTVARLLFGHKKEKYLTRCPYILKYICALYQQRPVSVLHREFIEKRWVTCCWLWGPVVGDHFGSINCRICWVSEWICRGK